MRLASTVLSLGNLLNGLPTYLSILALRDKQDNIFCISDLYSYDKNCDYP